jgi:hypothetical protein
VLGGLLVLGATIGLANWSAYRFLRHRLEPLYSVAREVHRGMAREQVLQVIQRHDARYVSKAFLPEGNITLSVRYGLAAFCSTAIGFRNGVLESTRTIGKDGPTDYCPDAPADIW